MNPLTWMSERRTRGRIGMITGLCLATATATAQAPGNDNVEAVIDFHNLVEGQIIDSVEVGRGITCLLYTSPSPRDQRGSRMPSSA